MKNNPSGVGGEAVAAASCQAAPPGAPNAARHRPHFPTALAVLRNVGDRMDALVAEALRASREGGSVTGHLEHLDRLVEIARRATRELAGG